MKIAVRHVIKIITVQKGGGGVELGVCLVCLYVTLFVKPIAWNLCNVYKR